MRLNVILSTISSRNYEFLKKQPFLRFDLNNKGFDYEQIQRLILRILIIEIGI